jgi:hypothetical protein
VYRSIPVLAPLDVLSECRAVAGIATFIRCVALPLLYVEIFLLLNMHIEYSVEHSFPHIVNDIDPLSMPRIARLAINFDEPIIIHCFTSMALVSSLVCVRYS